MAGALGGRCCLAGSLRGPGRRTLPCSPLTAATPVCTTLLPQVARDFSRNKYFDTAEAQEYGLIDQVVRPRRSAMLGV